jgi:uncharacterized protein (DUF2147 family)
MTMRAFAAGVVALLALAAGANLGAAPVASPIGRWVTEGGWSHVEIYQCGPHLCGRIVWLKEPREKDGSIKVDGKNPDPKKRAQTIRGLTILWNFAPTSDPGEWDGGRVYNPLDGDVYRAKLRMRPDGKLEMRGYVVLPLFGGSQYWERVK